MPSEHPGQPQVRQRAVHVVERVHKRLDHQERARGGRHPAGADQSPEARQGPADNRAGHHGSLRAVHAPVPSGYLAPGDRARHHGPELGLGPVVLELRLEELDPGDPVHVRQPGPGEDRVAEAAWITEPGEDLRVGADQAVVEQADEVARARTTGHGEHQRHVGVGEHAHHARRAPLGGPGEVPRPVPDALGQPYPVPVALEVGDQPVKLLR